MNEQGLNENDFAKDPLGAAAKVNALLRRVRAAAATSAATVLTTRGDLLTRNASALVRLAVGAANTVLKSDGTDPAWGTIATANIADDAVTFAKMQNITSDRLLGRDTASSGNVEEIALTAPLQFNGGPGIEVAASSDIASGVIELAVQSEMEAATDVVRAVTPGRVQFHPGVAKAWCLFDGTATGSNPPTVGYNVDSVERTAAGLYTVTFGTDFSGTDYVMVQSVADSVNATGIYAKILTRAAGSCTIRTNLNGAATDLEEVNLVFFGDQ